MPPSVADLERAIRRAEMGRGQTTLLKYLYEAGDDWVAREEITGEVRWGDSSSFTGVLSAFSTRVNHTEGIDGAPGYEAFIERRRLDGEERFRLRDEARLAIERVDDLLEAFDRSMEDLLDRKGVPVEFDPPSLQDTLDRSPDETPGRWRPTTPEDHLLQAYWEHMGGVIVPEVHIGGTGPADWPEGSASRRLDGLRFRSEYKDGITTATAIRQPQLRDLVAGRHVEVIEVKQVLNRPVIGQAIAGRDMFQRDYNPGSIEPVVVCGSGDPGLEWVCRRNGLRVEVVAPGGPD